MRSLLSNPKLANITAALALVVATAGTSYAAVNLPKNSVGTPQLKKNAVVSKKVKDGSLLAKDFAAGQLPAGPKGADGAKGADGTAVAYALVALDGTVDPTQSKGITQANMNKVGTGRYCISGLPFTPRHAVATLDAGSGSAIGPMLSVTVGKIFNSCPVGSQISVFTFRASDNNFVEQGFYLLVN